MNLDVMGSLEGQVGFWVLVTANQSLPSAGLSRAILIGMGQVLYALPFGGLMVLFGRLVEKSLSF